MFLTSVNELITTKRKEGLGYNEQSKLLASVLDGNWDGKNFKSL